MIEHSDPVWDLVWERLNAAFQRVVEAAGLAEFGLAWETGRWGNDATPFWAWLTIHRLGHDAQPIVLTVTFCKRDAGLSVGEFCSRHLLENRALLLHGRWCDER
jgi:hypothetical protein